MCSCFAVAAFKWQWQNDDGINWALYPDDISDELEAAHQKGMDSLDLGKTSHNMPYTVYFKKLEQCRNDTGRRRPVRRIATASIPQSMI